MNFKKMRKKAGYGQKTAAKRLGISNTTISMWETGASLPRTDNLPKIAALYGCTVDDLLRDEETETAEG